MGKDGTKKGKLATGEGVAGLDNLKDQGPSGIESGEGETIGKTPEEVAKGKAETAFMDEDIDGQKILPGQETPVPVEIKPLIAKVKEIEKVLKPNFAKARDALTSAQDKLSELAHKNIEHFTEADDKGTRVYKFGGATVKITFEKEKILTKLDEEE